MLKESVKSLNFTALGVDTRSEIFSDSLEANVFRVLPRFCPCLLLPALAALGCRMTPGAAPATVVPQKVVVNPAAPLTYPPAQTTAERPFFPGPSASTGAHQSRETKPSLSRDPKAVTERVVVVVASHSAEADRIVQGLATGKRVEDCLDPFPAPPEGPNTLQAARSTAEPAADSRFYRASYASVASEIPPLPPLFPSKSP
jgi:hypothetical protein